MKLKESKIKVLLFLGVLILIAILPSIVFAAETLTYENLDYVVEDNGEITITACNDENAISINIPAQIDGKNVTKIKDGALSAIETLEEITFPNTLKEIGLDVCSGNTSLKTINVPESVTKIGSNFAVGCTSLESATLPPNITTIEWHMFAGCTALKEITIPSNVTSINYYAFNDCDSLTKVTIPQSVTTLGEGVFANCSNLTNVTILNKTATIDSRGFNNCNSNLKFSVYTDSSAHVWAIANNYNYELIDMESTNLTDSKSQISLVLSAQPTAELKVETLEKSSEDYNKLLAKLSEGAQVIAVYDISVINGEYSGDIEITFTFDEYIDIEGKEVIILHQKANGEIEQFKETVKNSKITIVTKELSPFMIATAEKINTTVEETAGKNDNKLDDSPKTGVENILSEAIVLALISMIGIIWVIKKD